MEFGDLFIVQANDRGFQAMATLFNEHMAKNLPGWLVCGKTFQINQLLFENGMDPSLADWMGVIVLHQLARKGDIELAEQFLNQGANIQARDDDINSTPLGWAAKYGQIDMVQFLHTRGALKVHPDEPKWATPLEWAKRRQHATAVAMLSKAIDQITN